MTAIHIAEYRSADEDKLKAFVHALSPRARWFRYLAMLSDEALDVRLREALAARSHVLSLLALDGDRIVGHATCWSTGGSRAEFAMEVADPVQRHGIGTALFCQLAWRSRSRGIRTLEAIVHVDNILMLGIVANSGFASRASLEAGSVSLTVQLPDASQNGRATCA
ncbi:MAG: N-acetyltransferase family protein [Vulcanimicrobiaceae bacterium]